MGEEKGPRKAVEIQKKGRKLRPYHQIIMDWLASGGGAKTLLAMRSRPSPTLHAVFAAGAADPQGVEII